MMADVTAAAPANPDLVTPGVWGFVITFGVAVVVVLLIMDMVRRIRRVRYREDIARKLDGEQQDDEEPATEQRAAEQSTTTQRAATRTDATRAGHEHRDGDRPGQDRA